MLFHETLYLLGLFKTLAASFLGANVLEHRLVLEHQVSVELVPVSKLLPLLLIELQLQLGERVKSTLAVARDVVRLTTKTFKLEVQLVLLLPKVFLQLLNLLVYRRRLHNR